MNAHKGHEGLMVSGALAALAFSADGLPRRARADVGLVARRSAAHVGGQVEHRLSALAARVPYARSREEQIDLRIKALRAEQLGLRFGPDGKVYFSIGDRAINVKTKEGTQAAETETGSSISDVFVP